MNRYSAMVGLLVACLMQSACEDENLRDFQQNDPNEISFSTMLDDYPALRNLVYSLSLNEVSKGTAALIYENEPAFYETKDDMEALLLDRQQPVQNTIKLLKLILERTVEQDIRDSEAGASDYARGFYGFLDQLNRSDFHTRDELLQLARGLHEYNTQARTLAEAQEQDEATLSDMDHPLDQLELLTLIERVSKLAVQGDYPMWVDAENNLVVSRDAIDPATHTNLGLGNAAAGMSSLVLSVLQLGKDEKMREILKDLLRESSKLAASKVSAPGTPQRTGTEILQSMLLQDRSFFTVGGEKYDSSEPMYGPETYKDVYNTDSAAVYSNAEARNIVAMRKALMEGVFIRSDRPESFISPVDPNLEVGQANYRSSDDNKNYLLDLFLRNLRGIGFDPEAARLEESLYDLIRFDVYGRDRRLPQTGDARNDPFPASFLEHFLFLSSMSQNVGWLDGGDTDEINDSADPNKEHGHGESCEYISLNDSLYAMGASETLTINMYGIAFDDNGHHISRSHKTRFDRLDRHRFDMGFTTNQAAQRLMSGASPGDVGTPVGGNPSGFSYVTPQTVPSSWTGTKEAYCETRYQRGSSPEETTKLDYQTDAYVPFSPDGFGDTNPSRFILYWMARTAWNGEGPYYYRPSQPETTEFVHAGDSQNRQWEIFYRPNGQVYALRNTGTGKYLYPAVGDDPQDPGTDDEPPVLVEYNNRAQRFNRYKSVWYSDYYMIHHGISEGIDPNKFYTPEDMSGDATEAGRIRLKEKIQEHDPGRACASQIEAMYRNYQWLMGEKKFAVVAPLYLHALTDKAAVFQVIEGNGVAGLTGARLMTLDPEEGNGTWAVAGHKNEESLHPGDFRLTFLVHGSMFFMDSLLLNEAGVYETMKTGTVQPAIISENVAGVLRLGFPRVDKEHNVFGLLGSQEFAANDSDANWNRRNGLLPIVLTMLGTMLDNQDKDFSDEANRKITRDRMVKFTEGLMGQILPRFYYKKNNLGADYGSQSWVPRIIGHGPNDTEPQHRRLFRRSYEVNGPPTTPFGSWEERKYFQPIAMTTPLNLLFDSNAMSTNGVGISDGLLPLVTEYNVEELRGANNSPNTRLLTRAFELFVEVASERFDDAASVADLSEQAQGHQVDFDSLYDQWGPRRQLMFGLEQINTALKVTEAPIVRLMQNSPKRMRFEPWFFAEGEQSDKVEHSGYTEFRSFTNVREEDFVLNPSLDLINELLVSGIEDSVNDDWQDLKDNQKMLVALTTTEGEHGDRFYLLESVLGLVFDKILAHMHSPSRSQVEGLIHTLGMLGSEFMQGWEIKNELVTFLAVHYKRMGEISLGEFPGIADPTALRSAQRNKLGWRNIAKGISLNHDDGTAQYVIQTLNLSKEFSFGELLGDLKRFVDDYNDLLTEPDSEFWPELMQFLRDSSSEMVRAKYEFDPVEFMGDDFQYNGSMPPYDEESP